MAQQASKHTGNGEQGTKRAKEREALCVSGACARERKVRGEG